MKILIVSDSAVNGWKWPATATAELRRRFPAVEWEEMDASGARWQGASGHAAAGERFAAAGACIAWRLDPGWVHAAKLLRWVHSPAAGVQPLLQVPELVERPIVLTNAASVHAAAVAEHALALMLALARCLPLAVRQQERREWNLTGFRARCRDLSGSTALIVGLGHIGSELARRLLALGVRVQGIRRHPEAVSASGPIEDVEVHAPGDLHALLPGADFVVLALPATPETRSLLAAGEFARMRPGAFVINVGRGWALDEAALTAALDAGQLAGAGLDVFAREPLPVSSPLWTHAKVLITPHVASTDPGVWQRQVDLAARHLERVLAGELPYPCIDKRRGY